MSHHAVPRPRGRRKGRIPSMEKKNVDNCCSKTCKTKTIADRKEGADHVDVTSTWLVRTTRRETKKEMRFP
uniref:Uncharacterized protein n=1 Tax=Oryza rufipogon TaxID=4529 RepID=A0A0E0PSW7_ORYRU